jgi:hypothetical protein
MDHATRDTRADHPAPRPATERAPATDNRILELQRTAGNQAVAKLLNVQRHQLDPEHMDEQGGGS